MIRSSTFVNPKCLVTSNYGEIKVIYLTLNKIINLKAFFIYFAVQEIYLWKLSDVILLMKIFISNNK